MYNALVKIVCRDEHKMIFRVYPDAIKIKYQAGQYGALGLSNHVNRIDRETLFRKNGELLIKRAYSLSSPILDEQDHLLDPSHLNYYEFYVDLVLADEESKPRLSPRLFFLNDNDRIYVGPKIVGHYTLQTREKERNVLFISTTTGESPHNSMILELLKNNEAMAMSNLVVSEKGWISAYHNVHRRLMKLIPHYKYITFQNDAGFRNLETFLEQCLRDSRFSQEAMGWEVNAKNTHIYLCGDPRMIGAPLKLGGWKYEYPDYGLMRLLQKFKFQPSTRFQLGNVSFESYW